MTVMTTSSSMIVKPRIFCEEVWVVSGIGVRWSDEAIKG
jgi:hypothetical protein